MANSPLNGGDLPPVPDQVLQDMAVAEFKTQLRIAVDALTRIGDNAEQFVGSSIAREYIAQQLDRVERACNELSSLMIEHGCTIDLDAGDPTIDVDIEWYLDRLGLPITPKGGGA